MEQLVLFNGTSVSPESRVKIVPNNRQRPARARVLNKEGGRRAKPVRLSDQIHVLACAVLDITRTCGLEGWEDILVDHFPEVGGPEPTDAEDCDGPTKTR